MFCAGIDQLWDSVPQTASYSSHSVSAGVKPVPTCAKTCISPDAIKSSPGLCMNSFLGSASSVMPVLYSRDQISDVLRRNFEATLSYKGQSLEVYRVAPCKYFISVCDFVTPGNKLRTVPILIVLLLRFHCCLLFP